MGGAPLTHCSTGPKACFLYKQAPYKICAPCSQTSLFATQGKWGALGRGRSQMMWNEVGVPMILPM